MTEYGHTPDPRVLGDWLSGYLPGYRGPLSVVQLSGGQSNPTFRLSTPSEHYVLRRKPFGPLLPSAHAIDREFRVLSALQGTGVPVPRALTLCEDPQVIGASFYLMECVEGRLFRDSRMPGVSTRERAQLFDAMNSVIATLHALDPLVLGLEDFGRPGNYIERQISRWTKQYRASTTDPIDEMERLIEWLSARVPDEQRGRITHGDYKVDNLIFDAHEPRVRAVLDWELSTLGDPRADFGYHLMSWYLEPELFRGWAGEDLQRLGIPSERDYADAYAHRTGQGAPTDWRYFIVFSMFRLAAILQGIAKRSQQGNAADNQAERVGRQARPVAAKAWQIAQR